MGKFDNAPKEKEDDLDVYAKKMKDHNSMAHMYRETPDTALETHKFGSIHYLFVRIAYHQLDLKAHSAAQVR